MTTPSQRHEEKAAELVPCPHPVGDATCPFHWNSCRRTGVCDMRADIASTLASTEAEAKAELVARMMEPSEAMLSAAREVTIARDVWDVMLTAFARERAIPMPE